jgi:LuxR family maltose regulon positive regulatory protein
MVEVGVKDLAMDRLEAHALLEGAGVRLAEAEVAEPVGRTEGWLVGLYLAAMTHRPGGPRGADRAGLAGNHRLVAGYLHDQLLARLPQPTVSFLTRTAVLDRLSGPLCDTVLEATGSAGILTSLEASNLLVVPLDRRREWYRYHHLFRELLAAELNRREPELVPRLHARAAAWFEANNLPEEAVDHAQAAGDADRAARLVEDLAQPAYASGRAETARRWLGWFEDQA